MATVDVVVAGLGGFGSATAYALARRGSRVLGLDPRPAAHTEGASHGESRIVRQAYFEGAAYVPLLRRTYELWAELERTVPGEGSLVVPTGGLFLGRAGSRVLEGSLATAREWDVPHELLDAREVARRFPAFAPPPDALGLYEPGAGAVGPETAVRAHLAAAAAAGAELRHDTAVTGWRAVDGGVVVETTRGEVGAGALVLAPGRWTTELLGGLDLALRTERRVQFWYEPRRPDDFGVGRLPVWLWELADGSSLYGVPAMRPGGGAKAAVHASTGRPADAWSAAEVAAELAGLMPGLGAHVLREVPCWYTLTPDEHFVVGPHPASDRVLLACGFSGHGFKFTPVLGEVLADLVRDGRTGFDLSTFDPARLAAVR